MAQALTLLMLAIQLLTVVASTPNLPQSFRDNAVKIANIAIVEATTELSTQATSTQLISPDIIQAIVPIVIPQNIGSPSQVIISMDKSQVSVEQTISSNGVFLFKTRVLDANGDTINGAPISLKIGDASEDRKIDTRMTLQDSDYFHTFTEIIATTTTILFTSGDLTKEVTVVI